MLRQVSLRSRGYAARFPRPGRVVTVELPHCCRKENPGPNQSQQLLALLDGELFLSSSVFPFGNLRSGSGSAVRAAATCGVAIQGAVRCTRASAPVRSVCTIPDLPEAARRSTAAQEDVSGRPSR